MLGSTAQRRAPLRLERVGILRAVLLLAGRRSGQRHATGRIGQRTQPVDQLRALRQRHPATEQVTESTLVQA